MACKFDFFFENSLFYAISGLQLSAKIRKTRFLKVVYKGRPYMTSRIFMPFLRNIAHDALSLYYQNLQSIKEKLNNFYVAVLACDYDIIALSET